jgi:hypothetical protein
MYAMIPLDLRRFYREFFPWTNKGPDGVIDTLFLVHSNGYHMVCAPVRFFHVFFGKILIRKAECRIEHPNSGTPGFRCQWVIFYYFK